MRLVTTCRLFFDAVMDLLSIASFCSMERLRLCSCWEMRSARAVSVSASCRISWGPRRKEGAPNSRRGEAPAPCATGCEGCGPP